MKGAEKFIIIVSGTIATLISAPLGYYLNEKYGSYAEYASIGLAVLIFFACYRFFTLGKKSEKNQETK